MPRAPGHKVQDGSDQDNPGPDHVEEPEPQPKRRRILRGAHGEYGSSVLADTTVWVGNISAPLVKRTDQGVTRFVSL